LALLLGTISKHTVLNNESIEFDTWWVQASSISWIIDAGIPEFLFGLEILLLLSHYFFCGHNRLISLKVPRFNLLYSRFVLGPQLIELLVGHLTNGTPFIGDVTPDALGLKICGESLMLQLSHSGGWISHFDNFCIWI